ncbi:Nup85 Nucleoporin [Sphaeroforma arctica JP610]|uniref:Nuclear pore complex protein Nup85 n=1 Tax=Sphaeroforma arctica JP610 TaxID=667725 RepID=A0A0L0GA93_9EUKA|nr:Nup85 Nucleoporin [Sphaeroforma arctica JP610]KNC85829.1 Nup85 Nucleoporin [Sphaeroforma arctica JP610]|eukprot:XP_014159731.1 Nup85 Nucleoporin [Sphaeroforma arctica JP610]
MPLMNDMMYSSRLRDWKEWSRSIQADRNNLIAISERIKVVVAILCGDDWAISPKCESWIEYAIARLMFATPEITLDRVSEHTDQWFNAKPTTTSKTDGLHTGLLSDILKAVLKKDTVTVLEKSASLSEDSLLLTAHLADILFHLGGYHMNDTLSCGITLRQWFLMQYADQLLSQISLDDGECRMLEMAGNYYAQCGPQGARRFAIALQRIPIDSDNTGHRIIELAQEHGLVETVGYICSVQGAQCVRRNDYSAAVRWYTQGNHIRFAQRAANELLKSTLQRKCSDQPLRSMRSSANRLLVDQLKSSPQLNLNDTQAELLLRILEGGDEANTAYPPSRNIAQALKILTEERCNTIKL